MQKTMDWIIKHTGYLFGSILVIWGFYGVGMYFLFVDKGGISKAGTFGDMFGAINALFTGLALVAVLVSNIYQRQELKIQQIEMLESRKNLKLQRIENTIFNLIEAHRNNLNAVHERNNLKNGQELFDDVYSKVPLDFKYTSAFDLLDGYYEYLSSSKLIVFNSFTNILEFIDSLEDVTLNEKKQFARMFKAQLSLGTLFYYSVYAGFRNENNNPVAIDLMRKYDFLIEVP